MYFVSVAIVSASSFTVSLIAPEDALAAAKSLLPAVADFMPSPSASDVKRIEDRSR